MNIRRLLWGRILPAVLILTAYSRPGARAEEAGPSGDSATVSVYAIDRRAGPMADLADAAASMTLRYRSGRGETVILARTSGGKSPGEGAEGEIRSLVGSGEFVELFWGAGRVPSEPQASRGQDRGGPGRPLPPAREVLGRAHQGPRFEASLPASRLAEVTSAWVTLRRGNVSWTSEEFQGPSAPAEAERALLSAVDHTLRTIQDRVNEGATFMMLHPQAVILVRELAKLAPAGFRDDRGEFERERQWCLGVARAMDDAVAYGRWGQVGLLAMECRPRLRIMESLQQEPERPEVPTLDHQP